MSALNKRLLVTELFDIIEELAEDVYTARSGPYHSARVDSFHVEGDEIVATYTWYDPLCEYNMTGPDRYDTDRFPVAYLHDEGWYEREKEAAEEKNLRALRSRLQKEEEELLEAARAEKELFLTLKEKYEGT